MRNDALWKILISVLFVLVAMLILPQMPTSAQEGGFIDTFDDPNLPGWDHTPGVFVDQSILHIEPGNFIGHGGNWLNTHLITRIRLDGDGEVAFFYRTSEGGGYILVLSPNYIVSQRETAGQVTELGSIPSIELPWGEWLLLEIIEAGGEHRILINGVESLVSYDLDPLPAGGIGLEVLGGAFADIDDLQINAEEAEEGETNPGDTPQVDESQEKEEDQSQVSISSDPLPT